MNSDTPLTPSEFVAGFNQLLEYNLPTVVIEGEVLEFRVSKNRWVYFNIADSDSSVACFGTIYQIKSPIEEGMMIRLLVVPRLHNKFGFSLNVISIMPVGEGALKRSAELLKAKLSAEGLFNPKRKRPLPYAPQKIGLITSEGSAAYHDFIKILDERWVGVEIFLSDVLVQGENSAVSITNAIQIHNQSNYGIEVLVITRGGGSAEDLMAFNDERVVRAVASSRVPTLVAIGHEVDISLAELTADVRASTPSNAVSVLVPDRVNESQRTKTLNKHLNQKLITLIQDAQNQLKNTKSSLHANVTTIFKEQTVKLEHYKIVIENLNPKTILRRGYSIILANNKTLHSVANLKKGQDITNVLSDGKIVSTVKTINLEKS